MLHVMGTYFFGWGMVKEVLISALMARARLRSSSAGEVMGETGSESEEKASECRVVTSTGGVAVLSISSKIGDLGAGTVGEVGALTYRRLSIVLA
jgi:hypothetical protein